MTSYSPEFEHSVGTLLAERDSRWQETSVPDYENFEREQVLFAMRAIHAAVSDVAGSREYLDVDLALQKTEQFVQRSFDRYEGIGASEGFQWAFAVPARTTRDGGPEYASEITPFLPLLDPKYGVGSDVRQRAIVGLPPSVIDTYENNEDARGALVYTPIYADMTKDLGGIREATRVATKSINSTAGFVHYRLGANVMGLGATIPSLTKYGQTISEVGLTTTTGHGGTVYFIGETYNDLGETHGIKPRRIGVLGAAGAIGHSSIDYFYHQHPELEGIYMFDPKVSDGERFLEQRGWADKGVIESSERAVLEKSEVVIVAVTKEVDLDEIDPEHTLDLSGKIIIDDSQPGSFNREQVEARGGKLLWVVGWDQTPDRLLERSNGYDYGRVAGLFGRQAVWGCEAEVAMLASLSDVQERRDLAVTARVDQEQARRIGLELSNMGVTAAPAQSFGRIVKITR